MINIFFISGIDPASYGYKNAHPDERLSSDDAQVVDVIHTNACEDLSNMLTYSVCSFNYLLMKL